jgi:hypothetical protein
MVVVSGIISGVYLMCRGEQFLPLGTLGIVEVCFAIVKGIDKVNEYRVFIAENNGLA